MTEQPREQENGKNEKEREEPETSAPPVPRWRPAAEPTCCGSDCDDCPF